MAKSNVIPLPPVKDTTLRERIRKYAEIWISSGSKTQAYEAAGYSSVNSANAWNFHKQHHELITKEAAMYLSGSVPLALRTLNDIMTNGKSETARTKCALEVLDRSGLDKTTKIQIGGDEPTDQAALKKQLASLLQANPELAEED